MLPIHWRMAELWTIQQSGELTNEESIEVRLCMKANANYARKLADLYNLSLVASMVDDWDWQHEVCMEIDKLEIQYKVGKPE